MLTKLASLTTLIFCANAAQAESSSLEAQIRELQVQSRSQSEEIEKLKKLRHDSTSTKAFAEDNSRSTTVGGYGEVNYNQYSEDGSRNQMDLRRFVFSVGHRFNEELSFVGEIEWEHAIVSKSDDGEVGIEQAYIDWQLARSFHMKAGLFLMPFGFLNESHEPPTFYGVERNEIETRIIPTTWREGGVGIFGGTEVGLDWSLGVVTGFNMAKLDNSKAPLASSHQELQTAKARDLAVFGSLKFVGSGGLAGVSIFSGKSTHGNADYKADNAKPSFAGINGRVTLGDVHARWQYRGLDLQGLYARGFIGDADQFNDAISTFNAANPNSKRTFVPTEFYGWLVQAAYKFNISTAYTLAPFARYEEFDTQLRMTNGLSSESTNRDRVATLGVSFHPHPEVVFKADFQSYAINTSGDRVNLGVGYMF